MFYNDPKPSKDVTGMIADWQGRSREERYKKQNYVLEFLISFVPRVKETITDNKLTLKNKNSKEMYKQFKLYFPCMLFWESVLKGTIWGVVGGRLQTEGLYVYTYG